MPKAFLVLWAIDIDRQEEACKEFPFWFIDIPHGAYVFLCVSWGWCISTLELAYLMFTIVSLPPQRSICLRQWENWCSALNWLLINDLSVKVEHKWVLPGAHGWKMSMGTRILKICFNTWQKRTELGTNTEHSSTIKCLFPLYILTQFG